MDGSPASLTAAVERIRPVIEKFAPQAERERRLPGEVYEAMLAAGLFRLSVPKSYGGLELHPVEAYGVWEAVARIDTAAAWNLVIGSLAAGYLPYLPQAAGDEIFASGPDVVFAGASAPPAAATRVERGWRLTGRVPYASGCDRADWFLVTALEHTGSQRSTAGPAPICAYVPRAQVRLEDTWHTSGMRGSGSGDFVLDDVLVPDHRSGVVAPLHDPPPAYQGPLYRLMFWQVSHGETMVALGATTAAIDRLVELAVAKTPTRSPTLLRERSMAQHHAARAKALIDAAREYIYAAISEAYRAAEHRKEITQDMKMRCQLAACFGTEACVQAVSLVFEAAGASAIREEFGIERQFRDINAMAQHANKSYMRYESVGKLMFGLPTDWFMLNL